MPPVFKPYTDGHILVLALQGLCPTTGCTWRVERDNLSLNLYIAYHQFKEGTEQYLIDDGVLDLDDISKIVNERHNYLSTIPQIYFDGGPLDGVYKDMSLDITPMSVQATVQGDEVVYELVGNSDGLFVYLYKETLDTVQPEALRGRPSGLRYEGRFDRMQETHKRWNPTDE